MNRSEKICKEIGERFLCKDFVYENLFATKNNNRVEICDALFEFCDTYLVIQIKQRDIITNDSSRELKWFNGVIDDAVSQIQTSIDILRNNKGIVVNDSYHQKVLLNNCYTIIPIILFDNSFIKEYRRIHSLDGYAINIFSLTDFSDALRVFAHPKIFYEYLNYRSNLKDSMFLPQLKIDEYSNELLLSSIYCEKDLAESFNKSFVLNNKINEDSLAKLMNIITLFREKIIGSKDLRYKNILKVFQYINPVSASIFVDRFEETRDFCLAGKMAKHRILKLLIDNRSIALWFCSLGSSRDLSSLEEDMMIIKNNKKCDSLLAMVFSRFDNNNFDVWFAFDE